MKGVDLSTYDDPFLLEPILSYVDGIAEGNNAAKAGIDIALHDWVGKKLRMLLYRLWGFEVRKTATTSFTIGIDRPEVVAQKVRETEDFPSSR